MALVGAGPVGLGMAKALLEHKIPYEQLEADSELGGNWYHGVYETVHIISSRKTTEYADYPMPVDYPDFPSRQQMLDYLRDYAEKFQLCFAYTIPYESGDGAAARRTGAGNWNWRVGRNACTRDCWFATDIIGTGGFRSIRENSRASSFIRKITEIPRS